MGLLKRQTRVLLWSPASPAELRASIRPPCRKQSAHRKITAGKDQQRAHQVLIHGHKGRPLAKYGLIHALWDLVSSVLLMPTRTDLNGRKQANNSDFPFRILSRYMRPIYQNQLASKGFNLVIRVFHPPLSSPVILTR